MKTKLITTKLVVVSFVSVAIVLISLNAGGGLEPTAPPGPTMHTLEDIYVAGEIGKHEPLPNAFDMFLKIDGVPGECTDDKHKEWIEVLSYSHEITMPVTIGDGGTRSSGRSEHADISVVKTLDKASPKLTLFCCKGKHLTSSDTPIRLELCKLSGEKYMEYRLYDVIVTAVKPAGSVQSWEALPLEEVSFNYGRVEWTYTEFDHNTGKPKGDIKAHWDVVANEGGLETEPEAKFER